MSLTQVCLDKPDRTVLDERPRDDRAWADPDRVLPTDPTRRTALVFVRSTTGRRRLAAGAWSSPCTSARSCWPFPSSRFVATPSSAWAGRTLIEWAPIGTVWVWRSTGGQLAYRRRVLTPRPAGTLALPGDAAGLRQWVDVETGAVMVHDLHAGISTAIIGVTHPAFVLLDPAEQERRGSAGDDPATACCPTAGPRSRSWNAPRPSPAGLTGLVGTPR